MTRIVVCDTGPLLHLSEIGAIHLLSLAGDIFARRWSWLGLRTIRMAGIRPSGSR